MIRFTTKPLPTAPLTDIIAAGLHHAFTLHPSTIARAQPPMHRETKELAHRRESRERCDTNADITALLTDRIGEAQHCGHSLTDEQLMREDFTPANLDECWTAAMASFKQRQAERSKARAAQ